MTKKNYIKTEPCPYFGSDDYYSTKPNENWKSHAKSLATELNRLLALHTYKSNNGEDRYYKIQHGVAISTAQEVIILFHKAINK